MYPQVDQIGENVPIDAVPSTGPGIGAVLLGAGGRHVRPGDVGAVEPAHLTDAAVAQLCRSAVADASVGDGSDGRRNGRTSADISEEER